MENEKGMHFIADVRKAKKRLQEEVSKFLNHFEKLYDTKVIKVCYELEQEEGKLPKYDIYPIKPEEIYIKLEDI